MEKPFHRKIVKAIREVACTILSMKARVFLFSFRHQKHFQTTCDFGQAMSFGVGKWKAAISQGMEDDDHFYSDSCHYSEYEYDEEV